MFNIVKYCTGTIAINDDNTWYSILYIGNHSRKKTFANFTDFEMIVNVFLLPFSMF